MGEETSAYSQYRGIIQALQRSAKAKGLELVVDKSVRKNYAIRRSQSRIVRKNYLQALEREGKPEYKDEIDSLRDSLNNAWTYVSYVSEGTANGQIVVIFDDQVESGESMLSVSYEPPGEKDILEPTAGFEVFPDGRINTEYTVLQQMTYTQAFEYLIMLATQ